MNLTGPEDLRIALEERPVRFRIGLLVLVTDHTAERDFRRLVTAPDVGVYVNRVQFSNPMTPANLRAMLPWVRDAAAAILPDEPLDALAFACTSGSALIGDDVMRDTLAEAKPGAPCVTPTSAARAALAALGARRVALLAPYGREVSELLGRYFEGLGLEMTVVRYLGIDDDRDVARIAADSIVEAGAATVGDAEALFMSCTALRGAALVPALEERLGRPVVTSNQALIWQALRSAGYREPLDGLGRLGRL